MKRPRGITMRLLVFGLGLLVATASFVAAQPAGASCELRLLDGVTRELKTYVPGAEPVEFPIDGVRGWSKCRMSEVKRQGTTGVRVDLSCTGASGQAMNASAVSVNQPVDRESNYSLTTMQLVGTDGGGYKEITMECRAR
jgi:hypothetical protein